MTPQRAGLVLPRPWWDKEPKTLNRLRVLCVSNALLFPPCLPPSLQPVRFVAE